VIGARRENLMSGLSRRVTLSLALAALCACAVAALAWASADVPVTTQKSAQIETSLAIGGKDGAIVAAFTDKRSAWGTGNCALNRSADGGQTWRADDERLPNITTGDRKFVKSADPAVAYSVKEHTFNYLCLATEKSGGRAIVYERSSDGGQTWSDPQILQRSGATRCNKDKKVVCSLDKDYLTVDNDEASQFYGRIYATWVVTDAGGHRGQIAVSHLDRDAGATHWSGVQLISGVNREGYGPMITAGGKKGSAYIGWCSRAQGVVADMCHADTVDILVSRSASGGVSWSRPSVVQTSSPGVPHQPQYQPPQHPPLSPDTFRINSFGTMSMNPMKDDDVRLVYTVSNGTDTDVVFTHADNHAGGAWSKPIDVGGGARDDQFFPWMVSLSDGSAWVCYYDESYTGRLDVSCSHSATGASFDPRKQVTDTPSTGPGFIGDYIGVAAGADDDKPAVLWADFRMGNGDVYFGRP